MFFRWSDQFYVFTFSLFLEKDCMKSETHNILTSYKRISIITFYLHWPEFDLQQMAST
jgi:hypothetical protein